MSTDETPSIIAWWARFTITTLSPRSPVIRVISQSGRRLSSGRARMRATSCLT